MNIGLRPADGQVVGAVFASRRTAGVSRGQEIEAGTANRRAPEVTGRESVHGQLVARLHVRCQVRPMESLETAASDLLPIQLDPGHVGSFARTETEALDPQRIGPIAAAGHHPNGPNSAYTVEVVPCGGNDYPTRSTVSIGQPYQEPATDVDPPSFLY